MNIGDEEELQLIIDTYSGLTWNNQRRGIWLGGEQIPLEDISYKYPVLQHLFQTPVCETRQLKINFHC